MGGWNHGENPAESWELGGAPGAGSKHKSVPWLRLPRGRKGLLLEHAQAGGWQSAWQAQP